MTMAMEFHDSWLRALVCGEDGVGYALFHAVIFRSEGQVFKDAQESGWQDLRFDFEGMRIEGKVVDLTYDPYASDGDIWVDGKNQNGVAQLPANHSGAIYLEIQLNPSFERLRIYASKTSTTLIGDFEIEHNWDADGNITPA